MQIYKLKLCQVVVSHLPCCHTCPTHNHTLLQQSKLQRSIVVYPLAKLNSSCSRLCMCKFVCLCVCLHVSVCLCVLVCATSLRCVCSAVVIKGGPGPGSWTWARAVLPQLQLLLLLLFIPAAPLAPPFALCPLYVSPAPWLVPCCWPHFSNIYRCSCRAWALVLVQAQVVVASC